MRKSTTKRALLMSGLAILLSISMLVGTTFAWFTDTVSSGTNQIVAGNLDIELYHANKAIPGGEKVETTTKLFTDVALWEPGAMVYEKFTVANLGNLALKYQFALNALEATVVEDAEGNKVSFASMLKVAVVGENYNYDRAAILADTTLNWKPLESFTLSDELEGYDKDTDTEYPSDVFGIIIYWQPSDNDNLFNMNNGKTGTVSIELGVSLFATQAEAEEDGFDSTYDENAWAEGMQVFTADDLQAAINNAEPGEEIVLMDNIVVDEPIVIPAAPTTYSLRNATPAVVIDLNGKNITTAYNETTGKHAYAIDNYGSLVINGGTIEARGIYNRDGATMTVNGTKIVNLDMNGGSCIWSYGGKVYINDATLIGYTGCVYSEGYLEINGGTYTCYSGVTDDGVQVGPTYNIRSTGELVINGGEFTSRHGLLAIKGSAEINGGTYTMTSIGVITSHVFYVYGDSSNVVVNGGTFNCDLRTAQNNGSSMICVDAANVTVNVYGGTFNLTPEKYVAEGYKAVKVGNVYYVVEADINLVYDADSLKAALANGGKALLINNVEVAKNETITVANGKTVVVDLNGYKISSTADKSGNQELFLVKGNLTVKNGSIEYAASNNQGWGAMITIFDVTAGGAIVLDEVKASVSGSDMNFVAHLNNWGSASATITNCDFDLTYVAVRAFNSGNDMNTVTIKNTDVTGGARLFWVHNYTAEGKDDTTLTLDIYNNGNTSENAKPIRFGFDNEVYYTLDGKQLVTATTLAEVMAYAKNGNVIIDAQGANLGDFNYDGTFGNGTVLKNAKFTYVYGASVDGVATFENCEFVSDHSYSANFSDGSYTGKVIFNNCHFDGWSSFGDAITGVEMNNCTFDWNNPYSMLRFYQNAVLNNCKFIAIDGIDTNKTGTVVEFNNCTGIEGKIYNNTESGVVKVGTWIVDGVDISDTVTAW